MECPVCKDPMIVLDFDDVEVDYCTACQGIWLDAGELELLFGDAASSRAFIQAGGSAAPRGEAPRPCPICGRKMAKDITGGGASPVTYDRCGRGDGLWFDKGELAQILASVQRGPAGEKVVQFLREVFAGSAACPVDPQQA